MSPRYGITNGIDLHDLISLQTRSQHFRWVSALEVMNDLISDKIGVVRFGFFTLAFLVTWFDVI